MKKIFTNDKFFLIVTIIAIVGTLFYSGVLSFFYPSMIGFYIVGVGVKACTLVLYLSYIRHSKNIMKGMMGASLMADVIYSSFYWSIASDNLDKIFSPIFTALAVLLFINHFIINADHKASPLNIKINQIIVILFAIAVAVWSILWIPKANNILEAISDVIYIFAFACNMAVVVCVESRLDAYRLDREAAGWNEKDGYPEGYVHEYEKK